MNDEVKNSILRLQMILLEFLVLE